jgi:hypothetical protein
MLTRHRIKISMDDRNCWRDNLFVERLWRSVKYEDVYLHAYENVSAAKDGIGKYFMLYNSRRTHTALDRKTPDHVYFQSITSLPSRRQHNHRRLPLISAVKLSRKEVPPLSIAITAPQKFDFQDIVCVDMMLRFSSFQSATFFAEPRDGEDGELRSAGPNPASCYEIQVKGAKGTVTLRAVASCLAHAPARRAEQTLLERLFNDRDRIAVLVMEGRLDDDTSIFAVDRNWRGETHAANRISAAKTKMLLKAFAEAEVGGSEGLKLNSERKAHNAEFARSADFKEVRDALHRLVIIEQVNEATLEAQCADRIRLDHGVPGDRIADVLRQLRVVVKNAKSNSADAMPAARKALASAAQFSIRPESYVQRGVEASLLDIVSHQRVLLLSGTPRVGKSFIARWLAAEFVQHGYDVQEFGDVESAERFLLDSGSSLRLAVLDDPFGGSQIAPEATRALERLERLIRKLKPQRKLIVAQGLSVLLETSRAASLNAVTTSNTKWHDTSDLPSQFLVNIWNSLTSVIQVDASLCKYIAEALRDGDLQLEPGCLEHLAANVHRLPLLPTLKDLERLGRESALDLSRALVTDGLDSIAVAIALTTHAQEPIHFVELAYVRGTGSATLPSKSPFDGVVIELGGPKSPGPTPKYDGSPKLTSEDEKDLDGLERRRLIAIDEAPSARFIHPFYRAAAEQLIQAPTHLFLQMVIQTVERGLFCLSSRTSRATARNLDWVFDLLNPRDDMRSALVEHAMEGLKSFFPSTRDFCFQFLVRRLNELPREHQSELPRWIASVSSIKLSNLQWTNGEPHLPFSEHLGIEYLAGAFKKIRRDEVETELTLLDRPGPFVSAERAAHALSYLKSEPNTITLAMIERLLSYDEAALRAEALKIWLTKDRKDDEGVLERIFLDDHPSCAIAALGGVIRGWCDCDATRRARLLDGLAQLARNFATSAALLDRLVLFDRVEKTGLHPPWEIFERLLPIVMDVLPYNAAFADARLFSVARSALKVMRPESLVSICDGWISWLERNERAGELPSEFSLGVTDVLLTATQGRPDLRGERVRRLLAFNGTGAATTFVADLVEGWEVLTVEERNALLARLTCGRLDDRWLQAVALTRRDVPPDVVSRLLPPELDLTDPEHLQAKMHRDLFEAALHVYTGSPQPLWWLGTHRRGDLFWEAVVEATARLPDHPLFDLAWDHVACGGEGKRVAKLIADVGPSSADRMLEILLRLKVGRVGDFMPEAWAMLLSLAGDDVQHAGWIDRIAKALPAILDGLEDLPLWLSEKRDQRGILNYLKSDVAFLGMVRTVRDLPESGATNDVKDKLTLLLPPLCRERPPTLFRTCDQLLEQLTRLSINTPDLVAALETRREVILAERQSIKKALEQIDPPLVGWIRP